MTHSLRLRRAATIALVAVLPLLLTGCPEAGMLASSQKTFTMSDTAPHARPIPDYYAAATDVAKSLGFDVSGIDRGAQQIQFRKAASTFSYAVIGRMEDIVVTLTLEKDERTLDLRIQSTGNFNTASQESVSKLLADFKAGLAARLGS